MARTPKDPSKPKIPRLPKTQYPAPRGRTVPESARRKMYESFRQHGDEVREMLIGFVRDDTIDPGHRIAAGKEILNRGFGTAPNIEIIEQSFKHQHSFDMDAIKQMPAEELAVLEAAITRFIKIDEDAIDAEVIEHKP